MTLIRFDDFEFDRAAYRLRRGGERIAVEPKVLEVLAVLIEHPDRVIPKQELLDTVWPDQYVTESVLTQAIYEIRKALGESSRDQGHVRTVHGRGYQFRGGLEIIDSESEPRAQSTVEAGSRQPGRGSWRTTVSAVGLAALVATAALFWLQDSGEPAASRSHALEPLYPRTALAVLPFRDFSTDPQHAYFAGGLHDELLTQLSRVAALSLRGRTSVMGYAETTKPVRQIGEELQVGALLEGSVQVVGERLRVNVQLIDAATDEHLWAESYDGTLDEAFAIQSDVAQQVVVAVGAALESSEQHALAEAPTAHAHAYRLYLQGLQYSRRPGSRQENFEIAQHLFERALELDPELALAQVGLSQIHGVMHWLRYDPSPARAAAQRHAAEEALRLSPGLPQARMALGQWHYLGQRDWDSALAQYEIAQRGLPNDAELVTWIGFAHRRLGNWDEAYSAFKRAAELDPRDERVFGDLGAGICIVTRRYEEAVQAYDRALDLAPDYTSAAVGRAWTYAAWRGDLAPLRAVLDEIPRDANAGGSLGSAALAELLLWEGDAVSLLEHLEDMPDVLQGLIVFAPKGLYAAWSHQLRGELTAARADFETALQRLDAVSQDLEDDWRVHAARGLALAGMGRHDEALREARWLEQSIVYREDAFFGPFLIRNRAWILAGIGEFEASLDEIERLLSDPSHDSVHTLWLDPRFEPVRSHPRFQDLLERYAEP